MPRPPSIRPRAIFNAGKFPRSRLLVLGQQDPDYRSERPRTYAECQAQGLGLTRACPFVSCKWHLAVDVDAVNGTIRVHLDAWDAEEQTIDVARMPSTCALGVTARHPEGMTLDEIGSMLGLTRERVRQLETRALAAIQAPAARIE